MNTLLLNCSSHRTGVIVWTTLWSVPLCLSRRSYPVPCHPARCFMSQCVAVGRRWDLVHCSGPHGKTGSALPGSCLSRDVAAALYCSVIQVGVPTIHLSESLHNARCIGRGNANKPIKSSSFRKTHFLSAVGYWLMVWAPFELEREHWSLGLSIRNAVQLGQFSFKGTWECQDYCTQRITSAGSIEHKRKQLQCLLGRKGKYFAMDF